MKNLIALSFFLFSLNSLAQIKFYTPEPDKAEAVMGIFNKYYQEMFDRWKNKPVIRFIKVDDAIQGSAGLPLNVPSYDYYSGLFLAATVENLAWVTCHETGHILGKVSLKETGHFFHGQFESSPEGEADYWGGKCVLEYVQEKNLTTSEIHPSCLDQAEQEQGFCSYAIKVVLDSFYNLSAKSLKDKVIDPEAAKLKHFEQLNGISWSHPDFNCRALSAINGITGKERPTCWYNPKKK